MSTNIWNLKQPTRTGYYKIKSKSNELYGTVIKAKVNEKTATVKVSRFKYINQINKWV